jgi:hypothetical protein
VSDTGHIRFADRGRCYSMRFGDDDGYEDDHCDLYEASECRYPCSLLRPCRLAPPISGPSGYRRRRRKLGYRLWPPRRHPQDTE